MSFTCAADGSEEVEAAEGRWQLTDQTRLPRPLGGTVTLVAVDQILAGSSVIAGVRRAVVDVCEGGISCRSRFLFFKRGYVCGLSVNLLSVQEAPLQPAAH